MKPAEFYDAIAESYDSYYQKPVFQVEDLWLFQYPYQALGIEDSLNRVLDVGCGTGYWLKFHAPWEYVGLDISENMLHQAQLQHGAPRRYFLQGDMRQLPFLDNSFDVVTSAFALNYSLDVVQGLQELARVLCPSGYMHLVFYGPRYRMRRSYIVHAYQASVPVQFYRVRDMENWLRTFGLRVCLSYGVNIFLDMLQGVPLEGLARVARWEHALFAWMPSCAYHQVVVAQK